MTVDKNKTKTIVKLKKIKHHYSIYRQYSTTNSSCLIQKPLKQDTCNIQVQSARLTRGFPISDINNFKIYFNNLMNQIESKTLNKYLLAIYNYKKTINYKITEYNKTYIWFLSLVPGTELLKPLEFLE